MSEELIIVWLENDLIEVDLMPTLEGETILQFRDKKLPSDGFSGWENYCLWQF